MNHLYNADYSVLSKMYKDHNCCDGQCIYSYQCTSFTMGCTNQNLLYFQMDKWIPLYVIQAFRRKDANYKSYKHM